MKNKLPLLLAAALLLCLLGFTYQSKPPQWEYKFDFGTSEKKANELGSQGWELIAIQSTGPGLGNNVPTYVFRRMK